MSQTPPDQNANNVGNNATQVGHDYISNTSVSINLVFIIFFICVLAMGGLAWAINAGINPVGHSRFMDQASPAEQLETENP